MNQLCRDCGSFDFVETRDADLTCRRCGLVAQSHLIEDVYSTDAAFAAFIRDYDPWEPYAPPPAKKMKSTHSALRKKLEDHFDIPYSSDCGQLIQTLHDSQGTTSRRKDDAWSAVCVFIAAKIHKRGLPVQGVCNIFRVEVKDFWQEFTSALDAWKHLPVYKQIQSCFQEFDGITRMVHSMDTIPGDKRWPIIRMATQMSTDDRIMETMRSVKPSCISVTFIYIACQANGLNISKNELSKRFSISPVTITKHEARIQAALTAH